MVQCDFTDGETAQDLRVQIIDQHSKEISLKKAQAERENREQAELAFVQRHRPLTAADFNDITKQIYRAAELGRFEITVMRFQSSLCSDAGRAIVAGSADWADTLPLRPRTYYDHWVRTERPFGYHLKAMVLEYPGGMPGDVGLILDWRAAFSH